MAKIDSDFWNQFQILSEIFRKMFYCQDCKRKFEEPFVYCDDPSPNGIALPPGFYKYELCPCCKSDWIDEVTDEEETES